MADAATLGRRQEISDLQAVMSTREGRRFVWRLLGQAGAFRVPFVAGAPDVTAFNAGAQNFALSLLGEIMAEAPGSFLTMQREAIEDEQQRQAEADPDLGGGDPDYGLPAD